MKAEREKLADDLAEDFCRYEGTPETGSCPLAIETGCSACGCFEERVAAALRDYALAFGQRLLSFMGYWKDDEDCWWGTTYVRSLSQAFIEDQLLDGPTGPIPGGAIEIRQLGRIERTSGLAAMERLLTELGFVKSDTTEDWFAAKRIDCGRAAPDLAELLDREGGE